MKLPPPDPRLEKARYKLILDAPFFGALMVRLPIVRDDAVETFCTDGKTIRYNQPYADKLSEGELRYVLCHEIMHCALGHLWRMEGRDHAKWNEACDYVVNQQLDDYAATATGPVPWTRFAGWVDIAQHPEYRNLSAEEIYRLMVPPPDPNGQPPSQPPQPGQGGPPDPNAAPQPGEAAPNSQPSTLNHQPGIGDFTAPPADEVDENSGEPGAEGGLETDWKIATVQAERIAMMKGNCPGSASELAKAIKTPKVDWREVLREFIRARAASDYSFSRPNKRHLHRGFILPVLRNERMGRLVAAFDSSGSTRRYAADFATELQDALDMVKPERLDVIICDAQVQKVQSFEPGDTVEIDAKGGGGTDFRPVFEIIDDPKNAKAHPELEEFDEPPLCVVYLTDLDGTFPAVAPEYPVLWVAVNARGRKAPFGDTIAIEG